jgi:hypothetical protein
MKFNGVNTMQVIEQVIKLHDIARIVEQEIGQGQLSEDIRKCADRLSTLVKPLKESK